MPLAVALETALHDSTAGLGPSIYTVGLPEELAKAVPVLAVALIGYAKAGSGGGPHAAADAMLPALFGSRTPRPWWEH